jgi:polar amino acid transport system substrate-binding protein
MRTFLTLLWLAGTASAVASPLRVCTVVWPPHTVVAADGKTVSGHHTELVRQAAAKIGRPATIEAVAWERCLKDLAEGRYDAAYSASHTAERSVYAIYPARALASLSYVAIIRRAQAASAHGWSGGSGPALAVLPQPVAAPRGWSVTRELSQVAALQVDDGSLNSDQDVRKLLAGRVGTAIVEASSAREILARLDPEGRLMVLDAPVVPVRDYYLIVSKAAAGAAAAQHLAEQLAAALPEPAGVGKRMRPR